MQEFNKVSTISNFIKQLLNTTYLPVIRTIQAGDYIVKGRMYLYKCEIIECTNSGYLSPYVGSSLLPMATFRQIGEYRFGEKNGKLCHNFQSNREGYDSITHEKLGAYLRALRDMYGLNLMPLYNCFSNNPFSHYHVFPDRIVKTTYNYHTKLYKVPIRFNTDYTICMENIGTTTFAPAFIRNETLIYLDKTPIGDNIDVTNRYISLHNNQVVNYYGGLRFNDPIVIRYNNVPETKTIERKIILDGSSDTKYLEIKIDPARYFTAVSSDVDIAYLEALMNAGKLYQKVSSTDGYMERVTEIEDSEVGIIVYYVCNTDPNKLGWQEESSGEYSTTTDTSIDMSKTYYLKCSTIQDSYYTYDIEDVHCEMYDAVEDKLYLLIQVPESFDSNIVILEGDYTHTKSDKYYNQTDLRNLPENYLDNIFTSDIRLMRMNVQPFVPFSETLEQFLLWNPISSLDTINLDMDRLLKQLTELYLDVDPNYYANYWYYRYRELVSNYAKHNGVIFIDDNLGYVTTEIEALLNKNIPADREGLEGIGVVNGD